MIFCIGNIIYIMSCIKEHVYSRTYQQKKKGFISLLLPPAPLLSCLHPWQQSPQFPCAIRLSSLNTWVSLIFWEIPKAQRRLIRGIIFQEQKKIWHYARSLWGIWLNSGNINIPACTNDLSNTAEYHQQYFLLSWRRHIIYHSVRMNPSLKMELHIESVLC